jgi:hypothetical protein
MPSSNSYASEPCSFLQERQQNQQMQGKRRRRRKSTPTWSCSQQAGYYRQQNKQTFNTINIHTRQELYSVCVGRWLFIRYYFIKSGCVGGWGVKN